MLAVCPMSPGAISSGLLGLALLLLTRYGGGAAVTTADAPVDVFQSGQDGEEYWGSNCAVDCPRLPCICWLLRTHAAQPELKCASDSRR
jgi:hypothetical protein